MWTWDVRTQLVWVEFLKKTACLSILYYCRAVRDVEVNNLFIKCVVYMIQDRVDYSLLVLMFGCIKCLNLTPLKYANSLKTNTYISLGFVLFVFLHNNLHMISGFTLWRCKWKMNTMWHYTTLCLIMLSHLNLDVILELSLHASS